MGMCLLDRLQIRDNKDTWFNINKTSIWHFSSDQHLLDVDPKIFAVSNVINDIVIMILLIT